MYLCVYMYVYIRPPIHERLKLDSRGSDASGLSNFHGWNSQVHRGFPRNLESFVLSLRIPSLRIRSLPIDRIRLAEHRRILTKPCLAVWVRKPLELRTFKGFLTNAAPTIIMKSLHRLWSKRRRVGESGRTGNRKRGRKQT